MRSFSKRLNFESESATQKPVETCVSDVLVQLVDAGSLVLKFWLTTSPEEQLRRFQEREALGFKHYKITPEDWRNREKWAAYQAAAAEMIERTSTEIAPWTLVEAEDKLHARLKVLATVESALEGALRGRR